MAPAWRLIISTQRHRTDANKQKAVPNATKKEKWKMKEQKNKNEGTNSSELQQQQAQFKMTSILFTTHSVLFLCIAVRCRRSGLWRFRLQSFSVLLGALFRLLLGSSRSFRSFGCNDDNIFFCCYCRLSLSPSLFSIHLKWKICKRQAAEAQPTEAKEHEILAKNGQTKQWFREINKNEKEKRK